MIKRFTAAAVAAAVAVMAMGAGAAYASTAPGTKLATLKVSGVTADYGNAVAISGTTAVVGEVNTSKAGLGPGKVFVFAKTSTGWKHTATLDASDQVAGTENSFGASVAVSGSMIVVGAPSDTSPCTFCYTATTVIGRIYVFVKTATGWRQKGEIADPAAVAGKDGFGDTVATNGTTAYAGAPGGAQDPAGAVYAYSRTSSGSWKNIGTLTAADDGLGFSLSAAGNLLVAGAFAYSVTYTAAYVFTHTSSGWSRTTLASRANTIGSSFGFAVSLSWGKSPEIAVGAPTQNGFHGVVCVFSKTSTGWKQKAVIAHRSPLDEFGKYVAISGKALAATDTSASAAVYFYARSSSGWRLVRSVTQVPGSTTDGFTPVSMSGSFTLSGVEPVVSVGKAYVFES